MNQKPSQDFTFPTLALLSPQAFNAYIIATFPMLCIQHNRLWEQNRRLTEQADKNIRQLGESKEENRRLKNSENVPRELPKRKYSKRRIWLQKKYVCQLGTCRSAYSSKIALNLHIRKRHSQLKLEG